MARAPKAATPAASPDAAKNRSAAYSAAEKRLREAHADEFHQYMAEECIKVGVDYVRKLTPQEKAAAQIAALVAQFGTDIIPASATGEDASEKD